jgi:hypothetical protein
MVRSASGLLRSRPEDGGSPSPLSPDAGWGNYRSIDYSAPQIGRARDVGCMWTNKIRKQLKGKMQ